MILQQDIIDNQATVRSAVRELLAAAKRYQRTNYDYLLLLANAAYEKSLVGKSIMQNGHVLPFNPYTIDTTEGDYEDMHRREFYVTYINNIYQSELIYKSLTNEQKPIHFRVWTTVEFMIYTHIWESTWFLKTLKQLANLVSCTPYDWRVVESVPDFTRHDFIRNDIRSIYETRSLGIVDLMKKSFHSQIRNAFAHSDYYWRFQ